MEVIKKYIAVHEQPKRRAISSRFPILVRPAVFIKRSLRSVKNAVTLTKLQKKEYFPCVVARHSSKLYRTLGDSDFSLQKNKVKNLTIAVEMLDGLVIPSGKTFSLWKAVGVISAKKGYVEGMLLSNGRVSVGIGGGLCQLSNFLMWILLHADIEIKERHHHSVDAFPDSGRTLPFGGGATVFDNYLDLQIKNISKQPLQLKLWLTETSLKGQLLSTAPITHKYHVLEKNHCFINKKGTFFRYNEIYREMYIEGVKQYEEKIFTNFAPVVYEISVDALQRFGNTIHHIEEEVLY